MKKIISGLVIFFFISTNLSLPSPAAAATGEMSAPAYSLKIPTEIGSVAEYYPGKKGTVYYIQDAHSSLEAQENIAQLINHLTGSFKIPQVFVEGYEGRLPLDQLYPIADPVIKEKVSRFFMDYLRLNGAQYAYLNQKIKFDLVGIENFKNYQSDLSFYAEASQARPKIESDLSLIQKYLRNLGSKIYPPKIQEYLKLKERYETEKITLADYLFRIERIYTTIGVLDEKKYPNLAVLSQLRGKEVLSETEKRDLNRRLSEIDAKIFFTELVRFENDLKDHLIDSPIAKQNLAYEEKVLLLLKLSNQSVTPEEYELLLGIGDGNPAILDLDQPEPVFHGLTQKIADFLTKPLGKPMLFKTGWEVEMQKTLAFYEMARKRDHNFQTNLEKGIQASVPLILVTGGFHKNSLVRFLKEKGLETFVLTPRISRSDPIHEKRYEFLMSGGEYPFERALRLQALLQDTHVSQAASLGSAYVVSQVKAAESIALQGRVITAKDLAKEISKGDYVAQARSLGKKEEGAKVKDIAATIAIDLLTASEKLALAKRLIAFHKEMDEALKPYREKAEDAGLYTITIREQKRFISEFTKKLLGYVMTFSKEEAIEQAWADAEMIYRDMIPESASLKMNYAKWVAVPADKVTDSTFKSEPVLSVAPETRKLININAQLIKAAEVAGSQITDERKKTLQELAKTLKSHFDSVSSLQALQDKDGHLTIISGVSGSAGNTLKIWKEDDKGNFSVKTLKGHDSAVISLQVFQDKDGRLTIISGSYDKTIRIWKEEDKGNFSVKTLKGHDGIVVSLQVFRDQEGHLTIVSGSHDNTIKVWKEDGEGNFSTKTLEGHTNGICPLQAFQDKDGRLTVISGSIDKTIKIWREDETGHFQVKTLKGHIYTISSLQVFQDKDGRLTIISGSVDTTIKIWKENEKGNFSIKTLEGHTKTINSLQAFQDKDGRLSVVSGSEDQTIKIWKEDGEGNFSMKTLEGHTDSVSSLQVFQGKDGRLTIVSGSGDKTIKIWKLDEDLVKKEMRKEATSKIPAYVQDAQARVVRALETETPTLFVSPADSLNVLNETLQEEGSRRGNLVIETVTGTPFTDRTQIIGSRLPASGERAKKEKLPFEKGVLYRMIEEARKNPKKSYVFKIDQIEAIPSKVRAMLNQFLLTGEMEIPETGEKLTLPPNLRIFATITEGAVLEDSAFYDRFIRKQILPADLEELLATRFHFPEKITEALMATYLGMEMAGQKNLIGQFMILASYIQGRLKDQRKRLGRELTADEIWRIAAEEINLYFPRIHYDTFHADIRVDQQTLHVDFLADGVLLPPDLQKELGALVITPNMGQRITDLPRQTREWLKRVLETRPDVAEKIRKYLNQIRKIKRWIEFDKKTGELLIDGVTLELAPALSKELQDRIRVSKRSPEDEIKAFFKEKTGLILTEDSLGMLSAVARNIRYGTRVIRLEGPTGTGKTFTAEALSKLLGFLFYGEPIHGQSKQSKWLGVFKPNEAGDYVFDNETPFLQQLRDGGVTALSELNTAVQDNYAKLGWWLVPLARGDSAITLNEIPRPPNAEAPSPNLSHEGRGMSPTLQRHPNSIVIIDINPEESYAARGKLPPMLEAYTPAVRVEGVFEREELNEVAKGYLEELPAEVQTEYAGLLASLHYELQEELRKTDRTLSKEEIHILSLRELKRASEMLVAEYQASPVTSPVERMKLFLRTAQLHYASAFKNEEDQQRVMDVARRAIANLFDVPWDGRMKKIRPEAGNLFSQNLPKIANIPLSPNFKDPFEAVTMAQLENLKFSYPWYIRLVESFYFHDRIKKYPLVTAAVVSLLAGAAFTLFGTGGLLATLLVTALYLFSYKTFGKIVWSLDLLRLSPIVWYKAWFGKLPQPQLSPEEIEKANKELAAIAQEGTKKAVGGKAQPKTGKEIPEPVVQKKESTEKDELLTLLKDADFPKRDVVELVQKSLVENALPTLLALPAETDPVAVLRKALSGEKQPAVIERVRATLFMDEFALFGGPVVDEEAQARGERRYRWADGILPRIIREAQQAEAEGRLYVVAFENYHYLPAKLAVALNAILQEGIFYTSWDKQPITIPKNVRFFAGVTHDAEMELSPAEQSRWVRIYDNTVSPEFEVSVETGELPALISTLSLEDAIDLYERYAGNVVDEEVPSINNLFQHITSELRKLSPEQLVELLLKQAGRQGESVYPFPRFIDTFYKDHIFPNLTLHQLFRIVGSLEATDLVELRLAVVYALEKNFKKFIDLLDLKEILPFYARLLEIKDWKNVIDFSLTPLLAERLKVFASAMDMGQLVQFCNEFSEIPDREADSPLLDPIKARMKELVSNLSLQDTLKIFEILKGVKGATKVAKEYLAGFSLERLKALVPTLSKEELLLLIDQFADPEFLIWATPLLGLMQGRLKELTVAPNAMGVVMLCKALAQSKGWSKISPSLLPAIKVSLPKRIAKMSMEDFVQFLDQYFKAELPVEAQDALIPSLAGGFSEIIKPLPIEKVIKIHKDLMKGPHWEYLKESFTAEAVDYLKEKVSSMSDVESLIQFSNSVPGLVEGESAEELYIVIRAVFYVVVPKMDLRAALSVYKKCFIDKSLVINDTRTSDHLKKSLLIKFYEAHKRGDPVLHEFVMTTLTPEQAQQFLLEITSEKLRAVILASRIDKFPPSHGDALFTKASDLLGISSGKMSHDFITAKMMGPGPGMPFTKIFRPLKGVSPTPQVKPKVQFPKGHLAQEISQKARRDRLKPLPKTAEELNAFYPVKDPTLRPPDEELLVPVAELLSAEGEIVQAWQERKITVLEGEPGGGKTDIAIDTAERFGLPAHVYSAHARSHLHDFIGGFSQDASGRFVLTSEPDKDGHYKIPFLEYLTHGGVFIIDEGAIGKSSQALIAWLTGLARGEQTLVLNEYPGRSPRTLEVHPDFHIIITTNPPDETPGRESIPAEVLKRARRIHVPNDFTVTSYQLILNRFYTKFRGKRELPSDQKRGEWIELQQKMHQRVRKHVEDGRTENPERHLITLRDLKNWTRMMLEFYETSGDFQGAFEESFRLIYLRQFTEMEQAELKKELQALAPEKMLFMRVAPVVDTRSMKYAKAEPVPADKVTDSTFQPKPAVPVSMTTVRIDATSIESKLVQAVTDTGAKVTDERLKSLQELAKTLEGHKGIVTSLQVLQDKNGLLTIVSGSHDKTIKIWKEDVKGRFQVKTLEGHGDAVDSIQAIQDKDGRLTIVSGSADKTIKIWKEDDKGNFRVKTLEGYENPVSSLQVLQDKDGLLTIVSGGYDSKIRIWKEDDEGYFQVKILGGYEGFVTSLQVLQDKNGLLTIVSGSRDKKINIWKEDDKGNFQIKTLEGHANIVGALQVFQGKDGLLTVISGSADKTIKIWKEDGKGRFQVKTLEGHEGDVFSLQAFQSKDGLLTMVSGSRDEKIRVWKEDDKGHFQVKTLEGHDLNVFSLQVFQDKDGLLAIVSAGGDKTIKIWKLDEAEQKAARRKAVQVTTAPGTRPFKYAKEAPIPADALTNSTFHPAPAETVTPETSDLAGLESKPSQTVTDPVVTVTDERLKTLQELSKTIKSGSTVTDALTHHMIRDEQGRSIIVTGGYLLDPLGRGVVGIIKIWTEDGSGAFTVKTLEVPKEKISSVQVIRDKNGRLVIVTGSDYKSIRVWKEDDAGKFNVTELPGHTKNFNIAQVRWDEKGRLNIISGGLDNKIKVWKEVETGHFTVDTYPGHDATVAAIQILEDDAGRPIIITGAYDGKIKVWRQDAAGQFKIKTLTGMATHVYSLQAFRDKAGRLTIASAAQMTEGVELKGVVEFWREDEAGNYAVESLLTGSKEALEIRVVQDDEGRLTAVVGEGEHNFIILKEVGPGKWMGQSIDSDQMHELRSLQVVRNEGGWVTVVSMTAGGTLKIWELDEKEQREKRRQAAQAAAPVAPDTRPMKYAKPEIVPADQITNSTFKPEPAQPVVFQSSLLENVETQSVQAETEQAAAINDARGKSLQELVAMIPNPMETKAIEAFQDKEGQFTIVTADKKDNCIRIWKIDAYGKVQVRALKGHRSISNALQVLRDKAGRLIIVSGGAPDDSAVKIWREDESGNFNVQTLRGHTQAVNSVQAMLNDQNQITIVSGGSEGNIMVWAEEGPGKFLVKSVAAHHSGWLGVQTIRAFKNEKGHLTIVSAGGDDHFIKIWKQDETGNFSVKNLAGHTGPIYCLQVIPDTKGLLSIVSGSDDKTIRIWREDASGVFQIKTTPVLEVSTSVDAFKGSDGHLTIVSRGPLNYMHIGVWQENVDGTLQLKTLTGHRELIQALKLLVDTNNQLTILSATGDKIGIWRLDEAEQKAARRPAAQAAAPELETGGARIPSENALIADLANVLDTGLHGLLLCEPGSREKEILARFADEEGYESFDLAGSPETTVQDLLGGLFPILEGEVIPPSPKQVMGERQAREFRQKPGFLTRHMVEKDRGLSPEGTVPKKLLVIHNLDALPERVRAALNNFLIKGYVEYRDDSGRLQRMTLPPNVHIVATLSALSQREFSSAYFNRFVKLYVPKATSQQEGYSELLSLLMKDEGLSEWEARRVQSIFRMIKALEEGGEFWPSGKSYNLTLKEALLHGTFIRLAKEEAKRRGENIEDRAVLTRILVQEALRLYGNLLREHENDYEAFRDLILKRIFSHELVEELSGEVVQQAGVPRAFGGVPIPGQEAMKPEAVDSRYRLTMVPQIVRTLSSILRGWQAGRAVALTGETGVAKTTMGVFLAKLIGLDYYIYSMHAESKARDLTMALRLGADGTYQLETQKFLERIAKGNQVIIFDEANIRPEILWVLDEIAKGKKEFTVEIPGEKPQRVRLGENVHFLFTMNPESYAGRGELPGPILENIFKLWASSDYSDPALTEILDGFLTAETEKLSLLAAGAGLQSGLQRITLDNLLALVDEKGHEALQVIPPAELAELERQLLADPSVQKKMEAVRGAVRLSAPDVQLVFSIRGWWSESADGKVITVPLYELANPKRSKDAVIGLILHEIRHKRYTPTREEKKSIGAELGQVKTVEGLAFHSLWNVLEDIRIDLMQDPDLAGEDQYIGVMIQEYFRQPMTAEQKARAIEAAAKNPAGVFLNEVIGYGYRGTHSEAFNELPAELRQAIQEVTEGGAQSLLNLAAKQAGVLLDFRAIEQGLRSKDQEKRRAAKESLQVITEKIFPIFERLVKQSKGKPGEGGMPGPPQFMEVTPEQLQEMLQNAPQEALPEGVSAQQIILMVKGEMSPELLAELAKKAQEAKPQGPAQPQPGQQQGGIPTPQPGQQQPGQQPQTPQQAGQGQGEMSDEERDNLESQVESAIDAAKKKRLEEMRQNEPLNYRMTEVSLQGKRLAKGLIQVFRVPEEPEVEESPTGRIINPIRFLLRSLEPFDEEAEVLGKPNLALGVTIDASGSMSGYLPAIKKMLAIFMSTFQEVGRKKVEYSVTVDGEKPETLKGFEDKWSLEELNRQQGRIEQNINAGGGGVHLYDVVTEIIEKHKNSKKKNKIELILTDGSDTGGDLHYDIRRPQPSERLKKKLDEARRLGIEIVGVGFNTRDTEIFDSYFQLNKENAEEVVGALLKLAKTKATTGRISKGNLTKTLGIQKAEAKSIGKVMTAVDRKRILARYEAMQKHPPTVIVSFPNYEKEFSREQKEELEGYLLEAVPRMRLLVTDVSDPSKLPRVFRDKASVVRWTAHSLGEGTLSRLAGFIGRGNTVHLSKGISQASEITKDLSASKNRFLLVRQIQDGKGVLSLALLQAAGEDDLLKRDRQSGFLIPTDLGIAAIKELFLKILGERLIAEAA